MGKKQFKELVTGREDKTIGVEIEFTGVHYQNVIEEINRAGVPVVWERYNHNTPRGAWKLVYDVSVTRAGTGVGGGLELVSPPLTMDALSKQLKIICQALKQVGAKVDVSCGLHVHHDIKDLTLGEIKNVYELYNKHTVSLDTFFPPSRKESRWCQPIEYLMDRVRDAQSIEQMKVSVGGRVKRSGMRYHKLNFNSYITYGTLEFRQHAGTIDFEKIMRWVRISQQMIAAAKRKRKVSPLTAHMATRQTLAFTRDIFLEGTHEAEYFRTRRIEIQKAARQ